EFQLTKKPASRTPAASGNAKSPRGPHRSVGAAPPYDLSFAHCLHTSPLPRLWHGKYFTMSRNIRQQDMRYRKPPIHSILRIFFIWRNGCDNGLCAYRTSWMTYA
ncbi:MAG: hypothetical protein L6Q71_00330, partial [Planctomycetes bacterium]|nr:hypothetical protein [Planctomycetota bacterium]